MCKDTERTICTTLFLRSSMATRDWINEVRNQF